jgi:hypothetical protein
MKDFSFKIHAKYASYSLSINDIIHIPSVMFSENHSTLLSGVLIMVFPPTLLKMPSNPPSL